VALLSLVGGVSQAGLDHLSIGLSYNRGGHGYPPIIPFGSGAGSFGAIGGLCGGYLQAPALPPFGGIGGVCGLVCTNGGGGGFFPGGGGPWGGGGGGFGPSFPVLPPMPALPPPPQALPPHLAMPNLGWGPGFGSMPGPIVSGGPCIPCVAGVGGVAGIGGAGVIGAVPGGPYIGGGYYARNEWEKNDTADIVFATAIGLGMQTTNVMPLAVPRFGPTIVPGWFQTGPRPSSLVPRPHVGP
jgi:hypothetical protein